VFQFDTKLPYYYVMLVMTLGVLAVTYWFSQSKLGFYCVAIRENEDAAQALGVPIVRYKLFATGLSAFLSALAGTFFAQYVTFIDPFSIMGMALSIEVLIYPIIGGPGTVFGPLIGAAVLVPIAEVTRTLSGAGQTGLHLMVYGGFLIFAIMFMPEGLVGLLRSRGWLRRLTARTTVSTKAALGREAHREGA
jgi:branched-chain amino acid transport system permease protein